MIIPITHRPPRLRPLGVRRTPAATRPAASRDPLSPAILDDIAAGIASVRPLWQSVVRHDAEQRHPVRLLATGAYEVWVIGWMPEQGVELHDHGDSTGVLLVTEGVLTELRVDGQELCRDTLPEGSVHHLPLGLVHDVVNTSTAPATSIHVYSPPLSTMTHYDPITFGALQVERVLPEPALLSPGAGSAVLHPSTAASNA